VVSLKYSWFIVATAGLEKRSDGAILVQSPLMKFLMATKNDEVSHGHEENNIVDWVL